MLRLPYAAMNWFFLKPFTAVACWPLRPARLNEFSRVLHACKKISRPAVGYCCPAGIRFAHDSGCRRFARSANRPSQAQTSLLASIHKKTLARFSDHCGDSIAAAAFHRLRPLQESRARASNWLRASFVFYLFCARNISVVLL
jgi:hypothetical protein